MAPELMTPEEMALICGRAYRHMRPWSAQDFAQALTGRFALMCHDRQAFVLGQVIADEAEIHALACDPAVQGRGLGSGVLVAFEAQARARGAALVALEVAEDNAPARRFYLWHGYQLAARRKAYYPRHDGLAADALILRKMLEAGERTGE